MFYKSTTEADKMAHKIRLKLYSAYIYYYSLAVTELFRPRRGGGWRHRAGPG